MTGMVLQRDGFYELSARILLDGKNELRVSRQIPMGICSQLLGHYSRSIKLDMCTLEFSILSIVMLSVKYD